MGAVRSARRIGFGYGEGLFHLTRGDVSLRTMQACDRVLLGRYRK